MPAGRPGCVSRCFALDRALADHDPSGGQGFADGLKGIALGAKLADLGMEGARLARAAAGRAWRVKRHLVGSVVIHSWPGLGSLLHRSWSTGGPLRPALGSLSACSRFAHGSLARHVVCLGDIIGLPMAPRRAEIQRKIIGLEAPMRANTECGGECRIGALAPMSDTLAACREARGSGVHGTLVTRSDQRRLARLEGRARRALARSRRVAVRPGSSLPREAPRLCRGGSRSLTIPGVRRLPQASHVVATVMCRVPWRDTVREGRVPGQRDERNDVMHR